MANLKCTMTKEGILSNLNKGMDSEKRALNLCSELAKLVTDTEDQEYLHKIMADEGRHIKITQDLIDIVNNDYNGTVE